MSKLTQKNRKADLLAKLYLQIDSFQNFKSDQKDLTNNTHLRDNETSQEIQKDLNKMLLSNQNKKLRLRQKLISGPSTIDLTQQMQSLRWRIDVLRQNHNQKKTGSSLTLSKDKRQTSGSLLQMSNKRQYQQMSFDQLYQMQKKKYRQLRQRRKTKRNDIKYVQMMGNMQARKQKRKIQSEQKLQDQLRLLDKAIQD